MLEGMYAIWIGPFRSISIGLLFASILCNAIMVISNELRPCCNFPEDSYQITKRGMITIFIASGALGLVFFS